MLECVLWFKGWQIKCYEMFRNFRLSNLNFRYFHSPSLAQIFPQSLTEFTNLHITDLNKFFILHFLTYSSYALMKNERRRNEL